MGRCGVVGGCGARVWERRGRAVRVLFLGGGLLSVWLCARSGIGGLTWGFAGGVGLVGGVSGERCDGWRVAGGGSGAGVFGLGCDGFGVVGCTGVSGVWDKVGYLGISRFGCG